MHGYPVCRGTKSPVTGTFSSDRTAAPIGLINQCEPRPCQQITSNSAIFARSILLPRLQNPSMMEKGGDMLGENPGVEQSLHRAYMREFDHSVLPAKKSKLRL